MRRRGRHEPPPIGVGSERRSEHHVRRRLSLESQRRRTKRDPLHVLRPNWRGPFRGAKRLTSPASSEPPKPHPSHGTGVTIRLTTCASPPRATWTGRSSPSKPSREIFPHDQTDDQVRGFRRAGSRERSCSLSSPSRSLSLVVLAVANFVAADLRYSQIIDSHAKTLTSAESGIDYAVDRLRLNQTLCVTDTAGWRSSQPDRLRPQRYAVASACDRLRASARERD